MIVEINNYRYQMHIDLEAVCKAIGTKESCLEYGWNKERVLVVYPASRAKKLFTLFFEECSPDQIKDIDEYIMKCKNVKAKKAWQEVKNKWD